jgi:hypothetical protein
MSKARSILFILLAVFAVSAAYAASAAAHEIIIEGKSIRKGEVVAAEGSSIGPTSFEVEGEISSCNKSTSVDEFEHGGVSRSTTTSTECTSTTGCTISEPVVSKANVELVIFKEKLGVKVTPESEYFTSVTLAGCGHAGEWKVYGSQVNELPEAEGEKVSHETVETPAGSSLKVTGPEGPFAGYLEGRTTTKLTSGKTWHAT